MSHLTRSGTMSVNKNLADGFLEIASAAQQVHKAARLCQAALDRGEGTDPKVESDLLFWARDVRWAAEQHCMNPETP